MSEILGPLLCGLFCIGITTFVIIGVIVLLSVNRSRSREKAAVQMNWPAVTGRVTVARVEESVRTRVDDDAFYYPSIEFEYTIDGQIYTARQPVGKSTNLEFKAKSMLARYSSGTEIKVQYNPKKPTETRISIK